MVHRLSFVGNLFELNSVSQRSGLSVVSEYFYGEFDPGSGRTLAACLRNASRTDSSNTVSGERSRNT